MVAIAELWTFWPSWTWTNVSRAVPVLYELIDGRSGKESIPINTLVEILISLYNQPTKIYTLLW